MNKTVQNLTAVIAGIIVGSVVNMGIISISGSIIPLPEGSDNTTMEGLKASMDLFEAKHFLFPFLAHAFGTFVGSCLSAGLSRSKKITNAIVVGVFFLIGGIASVIMLPSPLWFSIVDLVFAYIPVSYFGGRLFSRHSNFVR